MRMSTRTTPEITWRAALLTLRTFLGIVYLTNGLAKLIGFSHFAIGPWTQYLIDRPGAKGSLAFDVHNASYGIPLARDFALKFVLPHWDVIGWIVTAGELGVGIGLLFGIFGRLAALGGFLMASMLFIWDLGAGGWTFDYLFDPVLLGILMLTPGLPGLDSVLPMRRRRS
jgi:thiosulfate dehydrogenase [quinone] large subunit